VKRPLVAILLGEEDIVVHAGHAFLIQDRASFAPLVERFLAARGP
jgi:hypothetical protein